MIRELKDKYNYSRVITLFSVLSITFCFLSCLIGELILPLASAFLAILFLYETPKKRIFSYVCPTVSIILAFLVKGPSAIIAVECVLLALIIAFCYSKSLSKAETAIYLTITASAFVFISLYLSAAFTIESFSLSDIKEHYLGIFLEFKNEFVELLSQFTLTNEQGEIENAMTVEDAQLIFKAFSTTFIALIAIFSFLIAGLTLKLYAKIVLKYSKHGILKKFAHFLPSPLCAYSYVISSILAIFSKDGSKFSLILLNINTIMLVVFAYMGVKYLLTVAKLSARRSVVYFLIALGFVSFPTFAPQIISYIGVWVAVRGSN